MKESSGSQYKFVSLYTFELGAYSKNAEGKSGILFNQKDMQRLMEIMAFRLIKNYQRGKLTPYYVAFKLIKLLVTSRLQAKFPIEFIAFY